MNKKIILSSFASLLFLSQASNAEVKFGDQKNPTATLAFNAGYNSAYVWRGIDQNSGSGSPYIGADLTTAPGIYLGVWTAAAQISSGNSQELDIYGGIAKTFGAFTVDVGVIEYRYPGANTASTPVNFLEYYGKVKLTPDKAPYSVQIAYFQDDTKGQKTSSTVSGRGKNYQEISGTYDLGFATLAASYGEYKNETDTTTVTLSKSLFDLNFAVSYLDVSKKANSIAATTANTDKQFFFNVSKTF